MTCSTSCKHSHSWGWMPRDPTRRERGDGKREGDLGVSAAPHSWSYAHSMVGTDPLLIFQMVWKKEPSGWSGQRTILFQSTDVSTNVNANVNVKNNLQARRVTYTPSISFLWWCTLGPFSTSVPHSNTNPCKLSSTTTALNCRPIL